MPERTRNKQETALAVAAMRLMARKGWQGFTIEALAKSGGVSVAFLKKRYKTPQEMIPLIVREITRQALSEAGKARGLPRDVLFDLLMARFDVLQRHRKAIESISDAAKKNRALACVLARALLESMAATAAAAKMDAPRAVAALGLSAIYGLAFLAWRKDKTRDMAKTMAALDKGLRLAEKAAEIFKQSF